MILVYLDFLITLIINFPIFVLSQFYPVAHIPKLRPYASLQKHILIFQVDNYGHIQQYALLKNLRLSVVSNEN